MKARKGNFGFPWFFTPFMSRSFPSWPDFISSIYAIPCLSHRVSPFSIYFVALLCRFGCPPGLPSLSPTLAFPILTISFRPIPFFLKFQIRGWFTIQWAHYRSELHVINSSLFRSLVYYKDGCRYWQSTTEFSSLFWQSFFISPLPPALGFSLILLNLANINCIFEISCHSFSLSFTIWKFCFYLKIRGWFGHFYWYLSDPNTAYTILINFPITHRHLNQYEGFFFKFHILI